AQSLEAVPGYSGLAERREPGRPPGRLASMELALSLGIPGGVLLLVAVGAAETLLRRRRRQTGTPLTETYVNEFTAMFYGTKRVELDHRDSWSMMRDEDAEGAPSTMGVDLDRGIVTLRPDGDTRRERR